MANITYTISSTTDGMPNWSGTIYGVDTTQTPANSIPSSVDGVVDGLTITFTPHIVNGYKVYPSTTDTNHYVTFRSQDISTQYPNSGYSLDIWSAALYNAINGGSTWQGLINGGPYNLNTTKYTLLYDYTPGSPLAQMWSRGGTILFV